MYRKYRKSRKVIVQETLYTLHWEETLNCTDEELKSTDSHTNPQKPDQTLSPRESTSSVLRRQRDCG